ncbi:MAG: glycosyltransferase [Clostridia bacterium]|nr:glycosyltransferase [Clostridia bacterium]
MCKLSIIVPIYNAGDNLKRCIESTISQDLEDTEILAINDGSTDNSREIIKKYEKENPQKITYYEKENTGVADTRNFGISKAKGKYILFVDSDDYIKQGLLEELKKYIEQDIDIIKFKLERVNENGDILEKVDGAVFDKCDGQTAFNRLCFNDVLLDSPCVYMFKKQLFEENNLQFKVNTEHEDFGLIPLVILKAKSIISINTYGYCYLQTKGSITRNEDYSKTLKKVNDTLIHYDNMLEFISKDNLTETTTKNLKTYYTNAIILKLKELKKEDLDIYIQKIRKRNMIANIQVNNVKQFVKKLILKINVKLYLKLK